MATTTSATGNRVAPVRFAPMRPDDLDVVLRIEQGSYSHPWSRRNFADSLRAGQYALCLWRREALIGYFVAMLGLDEVHLLNLTVAPDWRRQGWALALLESLVLWGRVQAARWLWLEVRADNTGALALYRRFGFAEVGRRRAYYPMGRGRYADAVLMTMALAETTP